MTHNPSSPPHVNMIMTQECGKVVQGLHYALLEEEQRLSDLTGLLLEMKGASDVFHQEEIDVVLSSIESCKSKISEMGQQIKSKVELYQTKIETLENVLAKRHALLRRFDHVLEKETAVAQTLVQFHSKLEHRLSELDAMMHQPEISSETALN